MIPRGTRQSMANRVDTVAGGVGSGSLNKCLISGRLLYNTDLFKPIGFSSENFSLSSLNFNTIGFSNNGSDTINSTVYELDW